MATTNGAGRTGMDRFGWRLAAWAAVAAVSTFALTPQADARPRRYAGYAPAYSAIVIDAKTGQTLHAEAADAHRFPASVTKVMTLYLLFEQIEAGRFTLQSPLRVSAEAASQPPSKLGVRPGSTITVEEAIRALVTKSANDVAVVIAENISGDEESFGQLMTRRARAIGMSRTTFRNASGLPDAEQVTTARDLATLGRAIQDHFPRYWRYFQTYSFAYRGVNHRNHNRLLGRVQGVDGIKTGYTRASGFNLLTSARRGEQQLVAVVLGGRSGGARDARMRQLLDGFFPRAYAGARTAPMVARASDPAPARAQTRIAVAAHVPVPGRREPVAAPLPVTPMAAAVVAAGQTRGGASTGASAAAPVMANAQGGRQVIRPEAPPAPVAASALAFTATRPAPAPAPASNGNPNPRPGVLGTIHASQLTTASVSPRPVQMAAAGPAPTAEAAARRRGEWSIQIGAFPTEDAAMATLREARESTGRQLGAADPYTEKVERSGMTLVRARFAGFDRASADAACRALRTNDYDCIPVRN